MPSGSTRGIMLNNLVERDNDSKKGHLARDARCRVWLGPRSECVKKQSMQRGSRSLHRPEIELGPKRSLMEVGGPEAQLIRNMAIGTELRKPEVECRLASEIRGSVHDRLTGKATLPRG